MTFEPEKSEMWYEALKEYIQHMDRRDSDYRRVLGLQSYLEIGLPHRGTWPCQYSRSSAVCGPAGRSGRTPFPAYRWKSGCPTGERAD